MNAGDQLQVRTMADDWPRLSLPQTMNNEKQADLIEGTVKEIQRLGLVDLTTAILDGLRPIAFIGGQLLWLAQPALSIFMDSKRITGLAQLLEQPEAIDSLLEHLEEF